MRRTVYGSKWWLRNLASYYKLNENFIDEVTNSADWGLNRSNDGRFSFVNGFFNKCGRVTNHIGIQNSNNIGLFSLTNKPFTFSVRIYKEGNSSAHNCVFTKRMYASSIGNTEEYALVVDTNNKISFGRFTNYVNYIFDATVDAINNNQWYHVVVTSNGFSIKIYVEGVEKTTTPYTVGNYTGMPETSAQFSLFNRPTIPHTGITFRGKIDEFIFWKNREFSSLDVLKLHNLNKELR